MKVFIYFNLHRKCWSIKALEGERKGRVIGHAQSVEVHGVMFKVSEAGRQRVLRTRKKNVHAGIVGQLAQWIPAWSEVGPIEGKPGGIPVTYNPYKGPSFVTLPDYTPLYMAGGAILNGRSVLAYSEL